MTTPDIDRICYGCMADLETPGIVCPGCGWDNSQRKDQWGRLPAMTLKNGRFFIGRPLGSGGFGVTYLGRDLLAGEFEDARRAIKEFFPMGMAIRKSDGVSVSPAASELVDAFEKRRERSRREGLRMASASANVNNVVRAYDCFQENGTTYIVMEYIDGDTLSAIVKKNGPFHWQEAYTLLKPVLVALKRMHDIHLYHMDISPDNIMLKHGPEGGFGEPYILDFGASIEMGSNDATRSKSSMTVRDGYTPPEQYTSTASDLSEKSEETACMDEYAICATLYYAITGLVPTSSTARLTGGKIQPMSSVDKTIPDYFERAISKGMSLNISDRYANIESLIAALENEKPQKKVQKRAQKTAEKKAPWKAIVVLAAVLVVGAVACVLLMNQPKKEIVLDEGGRFTWTKSAKVETGTLVGRDDARTIRYVLESGETVALPEAMLGRYEWTLEETQTNGTSKEFRIRS